MPAYPLSEGTYTVDESKIFLPFNAETDLLKDRPRSLLVEICPFLIVSTDGLIIIDPGLGLKNSEGNFSILKNLSALGYNSTDINLVLLSHLHKDHIGGVAYEADGEMKPMFPRAQYVFQQTEMNDALAKTDAVLKTASVSANPGSKSFEEKKLLFLNNEANKKTLHGNTQLTENIYCEISGGHTAHHQVFWINTRDENFFYGGDVLPQGTQLIRRFAAKYDYDGNKSAALRIQYGKKCAEENTTALFFHSSKNPISKIRMGDDGRFELIPT